MKLKLGDGLFLPAEVAGQTIALVGIRGSGKTNTAGVIAEELLDHHQPIVVLDPTDAWWGLRSEYPVFIFGGPHADLPLSETDGKTIAEFVVQEQVPLILSLRHLRKAAQRRLVTEFCEELYHLKGKPEYRSPLTVFIDEAPLFVPQKVMGEVARTVGAVEDLIARGRNSGFGVVLLSQRSATLNKDVLTQADTILAHRLPSPQDRKALAEWIEENATLEEYRTVLSSLPKLKTGEVWIWAPRFSLFRQAQIRPRHTFDSSAAPTGTAGVKPPKNLADVDLEKLKGKLAATIEKAKADDPRELRKQLVQVRVELAKAQHVVEKQPTKQAVSVQKLVLTDADHDRLGKLGASIEAAAGLMHEDLVLAGQRFRHTIDTALQSYGGSVDDVLVRATTALDEAFGKASVQKILGKLSTLNSQPPIQSPMNAQRPSPHERRAVPGITAPRPAPVVSSSNGHDLGRVHRAFLTVLANRQGKTTRRNQLAVFSGYSSKSRHVDNTISALRTSGHLVGSSDALAITDSGLDALGQWEELPTGRALIEYWIREAGIASGAMLRALVDAYPRTLSRDEVAEASNYSPTSRHVDNSLSYLRTLELVVGSREALSASEELFT